MKKINLTKIKKIIENYGANEALVELILNNVRQYNDLVVKYLNDDSKNNYLMYQLGVQLAKEISNLQKMYEKNNDIDNSTTEDSNVVDKFLNN